MAPAELLGPVQTLRTTRRRRLKRKKRSVRHDLRPTVVITAAVTGLMTVFLLVSVNSFDADEIKELSALVAALGPTVFGVLRYMKES